MNFLGLKMLRAIFRAGAAKISGPHIVEPGTTVRESDELEIGWRWHDAAEANAVSFDGGRIFVRVNGTMDGKNGRPLRKPSRFVQSLSKLRTERQFSRFLKLAVAENILEDNTSDALRWATHTTGLWVPHAKTAGGHVIKQVRHQEAGDYLAYAQVALLHGHNPLMPRIDAIIEGKISAWVVMEPLVEFEDLPDLNGKNL